MEFSVDKENKKISVKREFAAPRSKVWAAWTESEILDQWWAPKPWQAQTKTMEFREGGYWHYAMIGPDGSTHWSRADYQSITPLEKFSGQDAFSDENANINRSLPVSFWSTKFSETMDDSTMVSIEIKFDEITDLEKLVEMGFKEGLTAGMENLDELLDQN